LTNSQKLIKRIFDIVLSLLGLVFFGCIILISFIIVTIELKEFGLYIQRRVGKNGKIFNLIKIKTMRPISGILSTNTACNDPRITKIGYILRKLKIDELPQLWNVLIGDMSIIGPRPDVPGYADALKGSDRLILSIRPGITGPASIKYINEEKILSKQDNADEYYNNNIWPNKVKINRQYVQNYTIYNDVKLLFATLYTYTIEIFYK